MKFRTITIAASCLVLSGCSNQMVPAPPPPVPVLSNQVLKPLILDDAKHLGIVDGFYFGEEPRNFKTGYLLTKPEMKTEFALAYEDMLNKHGENMLLNWQSYVPYSQRADFAKNWWTEHCPDFRTQQKKYKILWMHEAMLDAGELWFRAVEKAARDSMDSSRVLTHDEEQRLVFKYAENDRSEGSLSTQF